MTNDLVKRLLEPVIDPFFGPLIEPIKNEAADRIKDLNAKVALYEAALKYIASNKDDWHLSDVAIDALGYDPEEGEE